MIFNSLIVLLTAGLTGTVILHSGLPMSIRVVLAILGFLIIAADAVWLNHFAWKNPRFLTYGPREYLRESELKHEQEMERLRQGKTQQ